MDINEWLNKLTALYGVTGFERDAALQIGEMCAGLFDDVKTDNLSTVTAVKRGTGKKNVRILIDAHFDRIGLIVTGIDDNGFVTFSALGGIDERTLPASEVKILGREEVYGIIGAKPPHLLTAEDKNKSAGIKNMLIDTGMNGEALRKKISVGDPILIDAPLLPLLGEDVCAGALDNRAGVAAVLAAVEQLINGGFDEEICVKLTSGEELGLHGAYAASRTEEFDLAIVVDTTFGRTPSCPEEMTFLSGSGAVICKGPNLSPTYTQRLINVAERENVPYEIELAAGSSGTNAWAYQVAKRGIPCVLISIPLRAMHTSAEALSKADIKATAELIFAALKDGDFLA